MRAARPPDFFSAQIAEARRFYLDLKPSRSGPLAVVCGGCEHCTPDYEIHRTGFPYWSIEFVAQGKGNLILQGKSYLLGAGTVFSYGPRISQHIRSDPERTLVKYFVDFTGRPAEPLLRRHGPAPGHVLQTSAPREILDLFDDLIRNGLRDTPYSSRISAVVLEHLILKIVETAIPFGSVETPAFATYRRCRQQIEEHWRSWQTLEEVARECHIDPAISVPLVPPVRSPEPLPVSAAPEDESRRRAASGSRGFRQAGRGGAWLQRCVPLFPRLQEGDASVAGPVRPVSASGVTREDPHPGPLP